MNNEHDVLSLVVEYHDHISAPYVPPVEDLRRGRRRVRRNRVLLAGGVALAGLSMVAAMSLSTGERSADPPQPAGHPWLSTPLVAPRSLLDVRELGFHVEPVSDVVLMGSWAIEPTMQSTDVKVFGEDGGTDVQVAVYYQGQSPDFPSTGTSAAITVNRAAGTYVVERRPNEWSAHLAWEYAPDSWAVVFARGDVAPPADLRNKLLTAAEAVWPGGPTVRIPVRIGTVPASVPSATTADSVSVDSSDGTWFMWLSFNDDIHLWATSNTGMDCQGSDGSPYTENITYRGYSGCRVDGERIGLRLGTANAFFDYGDADLGTGPSTEDMKQVLADLTFASSDPATWFDLQTGLDGKEPSPDSTEGFGAELEASLAQVPGWVVADAFPDSYDYAFAGPCTGDWAKGATSGGDGGGPAPGPIGTRVLPIGMGFHGFPSGAQASDAAARFAANLESCTATAWQVRPIAQTGAALASSATGVAWIQQTGDHVDVLQVPTTDGPPPADVQVGVAEWMVEYRAWQEQS